MHELQQEQIIRDFQAKRLRLIAYIRSQVGDLDLAEDLFQEISVILLQKARTFDSQRDLHAWCRGIARNVIRREWRKARRVKFFNDHERMLELIDEAFEENAEKEYIDGQRGRLRACMDKLTERAREMLSRRYMLGLSIREVAAACGQSELAAQVSLSRLRKSLSDCVKRSTDSLEARP